MPTHRKPSNHPLSPLWLGCLALFGLVSAVWMFCIIITLQPGGISPIWAGVNAIMLAVSLGLGWASVQSKKLPQQRIIDSCIQKSAWLRPLSAVLAYLFLGLVLFPAEQFPFLPSLFVRIQPIALFGFGTALVIMTAILCWQGRIDPSSFRIIFRTCKSQLRPFLIALAVLAGLVAFVFISRIGIRPDLYWKVAGVPLLPMQLYVAAGCVLLYHFLVEKWLPERFPTFKEHPARITAIIFLLIWLGTAACWSATPQSRSVFATGPYPPSDVMYPHSDAAVHDSGGAMIELGLPVNGGEFTDKPAYMFFIGLLHLLVGDDINQVVAGQVIVLALLPAVLFLLGKELHGPKTGLLLAIFSIYRSANAIQAVTDITTTSVKELMSETPLALTLAILCLLVIRYWKNRASLKYPLLLGGVYGISLLVRPHPLFFLPFILVLPVVICWKNFRRIAAHLSLFLLALALVLTPISISNIQHGRIPDYLQKINMVLKLRSEEAAAPAVVEGEDDQIIVPAPAAVLPTPAAQPSSQPEPSAPVVSAPQQPEPQTSSYEVIDNKAVRLLSHALHNEFTILLSMPGSVIFHDLDHTLSASFWDESGHWQGNLTAGQWMALIVNLAVLAVGLSFFLRRRRWIGLFPLVVQISVNLANSFARSSGGRFLVPVDWIIYLYYALGLIELGLFFFSRVDAEIEYAVNDRPQKQSFAVAVILAGFAIYGLALGYIQVIIPDHFTAQADPLAYLQNSPAAGLVDDELSGLPDLLSNTRTTWLQGRALYPRFYPAGQGEPSLHSEMRSLPYDRIVFELIGPQGNHFILLPSAVRGKKLQQGSDVMVFACKLDDNTYDAWAVVIDPQGSPDLLVRDPQMPYACQ